jgi:hypothetical protein
VSNFINSLQDTDTNNDPDDTDPETDPMPTPEEAVIAQAAREAVAADRARQAAIRGHAEADGRVTLADHLAMNTDMSVEDAAAILAASPKTAAAPAPAPKPEANQFANFMNADKHPNVGGDGTEGGETATQEKRSSRLLGDFTKATGMKSKGATTH